MKVAILDAGSQYCKLIDKKIRKLNVETEIFPLNYPLEDFYSEEYGGIIISGSPDSVTKKEALECDPGIFEIGVPILGICYGMQLIVSHFKGKVKKVKDFRNDGVLTIKIVSKSPLYTNIDEEVNVLLTHGDSCVKCPLDFTVDVAAENNVLYGISNVKKNIYGVQFHPEVDLTDIGDKLFKNFIMGICCIEPSFTVQNRMESMILELENECKTNKKSKYVVFVSGGVDSFVAVKLMLTALPADRIIAVHINTGFMRQYESENVCKLLEDNGVNVTYLDCSSDFLNGSAFIQQHKGNSEIEVLGYDDENLPIAYRNKPKFSPAVFVSHNLCEVVEPEFKRIIIGDIFMNIYKEKVLKTHLNSNEAILVQGTLRPDLIESASKLASSNADTIKTHHNDSPEVRKLREQGRVYEPLKDFHKDEVRMLAKELGLGDHIVKRQPFPGPGLAIRIICADSKVEDSNFLEIQYGLNYLVNYQMIIDQGFTKAEYDDILNIFSRTEMDELKKITKHETRLFCHVLPIKSVGVQGDERSYKNVVVLSSNGKPNWVNVSKLTKYMLRFYSNTNRVCYAFGSKINEDSITRLTRTRINRCTVDLLSKADNIANSILEERNELSKVSQMPVILIPVHFDNNIEYGYMNSKFSIVLRPVITDDFMTAKPAIPTETLSEEALYEVDNALRSKLHLISRVLIDLTSKPPGTIEWE